MIDPWFASALVLLSAIGGLLGHVVRMMDRRLRIDPKFALVRTLSSAFFGYLVLLACQEQQLSQNWTGVFVGLSGWFGTDLAALILRSWLMEHVGLKLPRDVPIRERHDDQS
jgi:hypothetical protein